MNLIRYNPARPNFGNFESFSRIFDDALRELGRYGLGEDDRTLRQHRRPPVDLYENGDAYLARFELPGVKKDDVEVSVEDGFLTVKATATRKDEETEESLSFHRTVAVPDGIRNEDIKAKLEDGVLTVTLPKEAPKQPKAIAID
jgi:HSP20 family protein